MGKKVENKKEKNTMKWVVQSFIITFFLSIFFSYISTYGVANLNLPLAILILVLIIFLGIVFDVIGVAVTVANEEEFHESYILVINI